MSTDLRLVYITTKDKAQAEQIGRHLVETKLAACVNILDGMTSIYWWRGKIDDARECVLIAKTAEANVAALVAEVKKVHSYEVPCALVLPVLGGNADYLTWLRESLK